MNVRDIRQMTDDALLNTVEDTREALFNLRFQKASGQLEDTNLLRFTRRNMARLLSVQRERQLAAQIAEEESNHAQ